MTDCAKKILFIDFTLTYVRTSMELQGCAVKSILNCIM